MWCGLVCRLRSLRIHKNSLVGFRWLIKWIDKPSGQLGWVGLAGCDIIIKKE